MKKCIGIILICSFFVACGKHATHDFAKTNSIVVDYLEEALGDDDHVSESDLMFLKGIFGPILPYDTISYEQECDPETYYAYIPKRDVGWLFAYHHYDVSLEIAEILTLLYYIPRDYTGVNYKEAYSLYCFLLKCEKEDQLDYIAEYLQHIYKEEFSQDNKSFIAIYKKAMYNLYGADWHIPFKINIVQRVVSARCLIDQVISKNSSDYKGRKSKIVDRFYKDVEKWLDQDDLSRLPNSYSDADFYLLGINFQIGYNEFCDDIGNLVQSKTEEWNNHMESLYDELDEIFDSSLDY